MSNKKGFTLIEMAVVLVVIGLIVGTIVPLLVTQSKTARLKEGKELLRTAKDEIIGYAYQHGCLPNSTDLISSRTDPWGKKIFYRVAYNGTGKSLSCTNPSNNPCNEVIVNSSSTELSVDGDNNIAFIVASGGPNHNKQFKWDFDDGTKVGQLTTYAFGKEVDEYSQDFSRPSDEYDDLVEKVSFSNLYGKIKQLCMLNPRPDPSPPPDISFGKNISEFNHIIESQNGVINVDEDSKTITIGGSDDLASGCIWYGHDTGPCTEGVCDLGSGFRAFFRFKSTHQDTSNDSEGFASGFTFAVTSDTESPPETVCGGNGAHLGYAGTQPDYEYWIGEPKMGVEVDYYPSTGGGCYGKNDGLNNHAALIYWGNFYKGNPSSPLENLCDDNRHGAGGTDNKNSLNPDNSSFGYSGSSGVTWLEDAEEHTLRIDLEYNSTSRNATIRTWVDMDGSNNTQKAMIADPTVTAETNISNSFKKQMKKIRFGWTVGSSEGQAVELSDFKINFLDYNSTNST